MISLYIFQESTKKVWLCCTLCNKITLLLNMLNWPSLVEHNYVFVVYFFHTPSSTTKLRFYCTSGDAKRSITKSQFLCGMYNEIMILHDHTMFFAPTCATKVYFCCALWGGYFWNFGMMVGANSNLIGTNSYSLVSLSDPPTITTHSPYLVYTTPFW